MATEPQLTPMMAQYRRLKSELPKEALLLFRLGDFYELFFEDAQAGAQLLNVALTRRGVVPMCGIPFHAANAYIGRLLKAGRKVAICDQMEDARPGQLVKREITQILSPGTHFDERLLAAERNNFLAAVCPAGKRFGISLVDLTTGDFLASELEDDTALLTELQRLRPTEIIYPAEANSLRELLSEGSSSTARAAAVTGGSGFYSANRVTPSTSTANLPASAMTGFGWILNGYEDWVFAAETALFTVREHFKVASLDGFGLRGRNAAIGAAGAALHYLTQHLRRDAANLTRMRFYERSDFLALDFTTLRHLEVMESIRPDGARNSSLYGAMNRTVTPMGARRLRDWLTQPLANLIAIERRQEAVEALVEYSAGLEQVRSQLAEVRDLERTLGRLSAGAGNARDLLALRTSLQQIPGLKQSLEAQAAAGEAARQKQAGSLLAPNSSETGTDTPPPAPALLRELEAEIQPEPELLDYLAKAIVDEPPLALKEGGLIRDGFDPALDELRAAMRGGKDWLARLQQDEINRTGIQSLKVRFNSVFGYYIEITRANLDKVPPTYIRKQTIANGERFITPELKEMEGKILGAEERSVKLEYELFQTVRERVLSRMPVIQRSASALAQVDALTSFAETARLFNYCRPRFEPDSLIVLKEGRHPVLEQNPTEERFVPNDTRLDRDTQIALITGPNMAGKSTYIRQVALLVLLAHAGSFIPATEARLGLVDRIFTRIGASDDLSRGQSTFMVEMCETANILNHATPRSLVVLDEIGRGTSTFDGLSLAWSILEHLHNQVGAKTLFATHYHELTELSARLPRLRNFNVAVREWHEQIVFLRKIVEGGADKSYGIQVARLAGVPKPVLERAKEILNNLEESELTPEGTVRQANRRERERLQKLAPTPQLDLFG